MTGEFSRRSFLKYTALTAVVVAGSSLLTGCGGDAPVQRAVGPSNRVLKVVSKLENIPISMALPILMPLPIPPPLSWW